VLTFNICGLPSTLAPLARRAAVFGRLIEESDIDVVNLQEVWTARQLATIRLHLPSFQHVAWRRGLVGQPRGGLVTLSRTPVSAVAYCSLRGAASPTGGSRFRLRTALNSRLQGMLTVIVNGVSVTNTHLTANHDGDWSSGNRHFLFQRRQLELLHTWLRGQSAEVAVVTGDFNIASDGPLYNSIVDDEWHDPFVDTDPATYHLEFLPAGARAHRIDYVLVRGEVVDSGTMFAERVDGLWMSDHVGLTATIA
jgi:endonuclease/exonuclease/phosphatase family metal-dependent hydrolase